MAAVKEMMQEVLHSADLNDILDIVIWRMLSGEGKDIEQTMLKCMARSCNSELKDRKARGLHEAARNISLGRGNVPKQSKEFLPAPPGHVKVPKWLAEELEQQRKKDAAPKPVAKKTAVKTAPPSVAWPFPKDPK